MPKANLVGKEFGKLTVIEFAGVNNHNKSLWKCSCECGGETIATTGNLNSGNSKSCGCEKHRGNRRTHGMADSRIYNIWSRMKARCLNENDAHYSDYGGRGISVNKEWINSFTKFYEWSIDNGYTDELTIDRIDVNGNYEPSNCRWITIGEQQKNKRNNIHIDINGIEMIASEWASISEAKSQTILSRVRKGWSGKDLIVEDARRKYDKELIVKALDEKNKTGLSLKKIADKYGINYYTLWNHYNKKSGVDCV